MSKIIAVIYGGRSAERAVSLASGKAVITALKQLGFTVIAFDSKERPITELSQLTIDLAFIALHGRGGEDGSLQGSLEQLNIPYTGSRILASALAMDKVRTKQLCQQMGIATAEFYVVTQQNHQQNDYQKIYHDLSTEHHSNGVMVKPALEGSSIGMSKVEQAKQLSSAVENALNHSDNVLIERLIHGPELTVSIINDKPLPVIEIRTPLTFYNYEAKYQAESTEYLCPAPISKEQSYELQRLAMKVYETVGLQSWGRVDFMMDKDQPMLLEVNTVPGLTSRSLVPMAAEAQGINYNELIAKIVHYENI